MTAPNDEADARLEGRSREVFDASVEALDARSRSKLNQARQRALEELRHARPVPWRVLVPAGGLAVAATLAILIGLYSGANGGGDTATAVPLDDLEIVAGGEAIEMIEDVEFYSWLAEQGGSHPADQSG